MTAKIVQTIIILSILGFSSWIATKTGNSFIAELRNENRDKIRDNC